jgi:hypothetical protein
MSQIIKIYMNSKIGSNRKMPFNYFSTMIRSEMQRNFY